MATAKSILLVEDEPLLGNLLKSRLAKEGFAVSLSRDGEDALRVLKEGLKPSLILLDVILPKVSGFELMEKLRSDPQHVEKIPIIVISNLGQESDATKGQSLGAVRYFVKAKVSIDELVDQVKKFLSLGK